MKITYRVVEATNIDALEELVNLMLAKDWRPAGGVSVNNGKFYQAVWKQT